MSYSKEIIQIGNTYKELIESGIKIDESSFINWVQQLYEVDYSTAKQGFNDGVNLLAMQQQAELSQDVNKDKALDNIVNNLDDKLSSEERAIAEVFNENE